jgi:hypothetical protein
LRDVCYLRGLSSLRNLWLADNPCSQEEGYRFAVLRALPQLEKLDDVPIKPEEIEGNAYYKLKKFFVVFYLHL